MCFCYAFVLNMFGHWRLSEPPAYSNYIEHVHTFIWTNLCVFFLEFSQISCMNFYDNVCIWQTSKSINFIFKRNTEITLFENFESFEFFSIIRPVNIRMYWNRPLNSCADFSRIDFISICTDMKSKTSRSSLRFQTILVAYTLFYEYHSNGCKIDHIKRGSNSWIKQWIKQHLTSHCLCFYFRQRILPPPLLLLLCN